MIFPRRWHAVALGVALASIPGVVLAQAGRAMEQDEPPKPIEEIAADFARDPGLPVHRLVGTCPAAGTWQRDLLSLLLENPTSSRQANTLINGQTYNVQNCHIPELDAWAREALVNPPSAWSVRPLVTALWYSERKSNRRAVMAALFDPEIDHRLREAMGDQLAGIPPLGIGPEAALRVFAEGYRETGMPPPPTPTMTALRRVSTDETAAAVKQTLLAAWLSRPSAPGSLAMLSHLWNDAVTDIHVGRREHTGWSRAVEAVLERVVRGELDVSEDVLRYATDRFPMMRVRD